MILRRTVAATALPVTAQEAADQCRLIDGEQANLVLGLMNVATDVVAQMSGRVLAPETWAMSVSSASGDLALPKSPVIGVTSITYYDPADVLQTAVLADFYVFSDPDSTIIRPKTGKTWPVTMAREDALTVTFQAGYQTVPPALKQAVLMLIAHLFENREAVVTGTIVSELPLGLQSLINLYRRDWLAA
jgi:uncharacterized phiE125 gp8 family phage protein